jgi:hypothetical protein
MNRLTFYDHIGAPLFRGRPSTGQTKGIDGILDFWIEHHASGDIRWLAYILATAHHETGASMQPVPEVGLGRGRPYGEPDAITGQTYYGRGLVQLTWKYNYAVQTRRLGVDLVSNPNLALSGPVATAILIEGMIDGVFTGDALGDHFNAKLNDPVGARRIVNRQDQALKIAGYHAQYLTALGGAAPVTPPPLAEVRTADSLNQQQLDRLVNAGTVANA